MHNVSDALPFQSYPALVRWRQCARPTTAAALLKGVSRLLVLVPHADDETLGCGGLIAAASDANIEVLVVVLTDGAGSHPGSRSWPPRRLSDQRSRELRRAVSILTSGHGRSRCLGLPDGGLGDAEPDLDWLPPADLIVTTWRDDPHPDHQAAFRIGETAARRNGARLLAFPLWVLTTDQSPPIDFPIYAIDIWPQLSRKRRALEAHTSQLGMLVRDDPHGFVLDNNLRALFVRNDEAFVDATPAPGECNLQQRGEHRLVAPPV